MPDLARCRSSLSHPSFLATVLPLGAALLFGACGNEQDGSTPLENGGSGGSSTTSTGNGTGGVAGRSETTPAAVDTCSTDDDCASSQSCALLPGASARGCYGTCPTGECANDSAACVADVYGTAVCVTACDPSAAGGCATEQTCHADANVSVGGFCVFAGSQDEGAPCSGAELVCSPGFECVYPAFAYFGVPRCAPRCAVSATSVMDGACETGTCEAVTGDVGGCIVDCNPFGEDTCTSGLVCEASIQLVAIDSTTSQGDFSGQCVLPGTKTAGEACTGGDCAAGLACGPVLNDYGLSYYRCGAPCSTEAPCDAGVCVALPLAGSDATHPGTCQSSCTNVGESCSDTEWCAPSLTTLGLGVCVTPGAGQLDDPCGSSAQCAAGLLCDPTERVCHPFCTPGGSDCAGAEQCVTTSSGVYGACSSA